MPAQRRRSLKIRTRLIWLVLACTIPLAAFSAVVTFQFAERQRDALQAGVLDRVRTLSRSVDRYVADVQISLQVLGQAPALRSADLESFHAHAVETVRIRGGIGIVLLDRSGQQLVNTNRPYGAPLAKRTDLRSQDRVFETGEPQVSDVITAALLRRPIISVEVPVIIDNAVRYVLAMGATADAITRLLKDQRLPAGWRAGVIDRNGTIITRIPNPQEFIGQPTGLRARIGEQEGQWVENTTADNVQVYGTFLRSPLTGWTVAIGVPRGAFDVPYRRFLAWVIGISTAVVILSLVVAVVASRAIVRPLHGLSRAALSLGRGTPIPDRRSGVREVDDVNDAMRVAQAELSERRQQREAAEGELRTALGQKEVLLREVHHRVKNNLQLIISMANLGRTLDADPRDLRERIRAMALVHDQLHQTSSSGQVDFLRYLKELSANIAETFDSDCVEIRCDGEQTFVYIDAAIPLGLIANEAIANAFKHGFPMGRRGHISVLLHQEQGAVIFVVEDDGVGGTDKPRREGFGTRLFNALAKQLDASFKHTHGAAGTRFTLRMPLK